PTFSINMLGIVFNPKSAWRRPAWFDTREIECVELRPKNVALVAQCLNDALLFGTRGGVVEHVLNGKCGVFRRFRQARLKVIKGGSEPGIVLAHFLHAQRDQIAGKKFGQRGSDALQKRPHTHQVEIFVSDEARRRQNLVCTDHPFSVKTGRFGQFYPAEDSAIALGVAVLTMSVLAMSVLAVVIHDAFSPDAAE